MARLVRDLRPQSIEYIMRKEDSWVFKFKFRMQEGNVLTDTDLTNQNVKGIVSRFSDNSWIDIATFEYQGNTFDAQNQQNGLYLDTTDNTNSTILFFADWYENNTAGQTLPNGLYRLEFTYTNILGLDRKCYSILIRITDDIRDEEAVIQDGIIHLIYQKLPDVNVTISNIIQ